MAVAARGADRRCQTHEATPLLLTTDVRALGEEHTCEVFGPVAVVARYDGENDLLDAVRRLPSSLTVSFHTGKGDEQVVQDALAVLRARSGRVVFNGYPTGVAGTWAQHHGGPWPSTNTGHTSVGTTSIRRSLRPIAYQSAPEHVLPVELRDDEPGIPRRVDGVPLAPRVHD